MMLSKIIPFKTILQISDIIYTLRLREKEGKEIDNQIFKKILFSIKKITEEDSYCMYTFIKEDLLFLSKKMEIKGIKRTMGKCDIIPIFISHIKNI